jgi:hypothetical protein
VESAGKREGFCYQWIAWERGWSAAAAGDTHKKMRERTESGGDVGV